MFEVLMTFRDGLREQKYHNGIEDFEQARELAKRLVQNPLLVRTIVRQKKLLLETKFCEVEAQIIVIGLNDLFAPDTLVFNLTGSNLYNVLASHLWDKYETGELSWCDEETLGIALSKLDALSPEESQRLLDEYRSGTIVD